MADPIELAAIERGAGAPVALVHGGIIHGGPAWAESIRPLAEAGYRAIAVDRRGHGRSAQGGADYIAVHLHADDLRFTLELRDAKEAHLVGVSYGALVCLEFALSWPERVLSLTLSEPSLITWLAPDPEYQVWAEQFARIEEEAMEGAPLEQWFPNWLNLIDGWMATKTTPGSSTWSLVERNAPLIFKEEPGWVYNPPRERVGELNVPALIVNGALSEPPMQAIGELLAKTIHGAQHIWIDKAGHDAHARQPEVFNSHLIDFLDHHDPEHLSMSPPPNRAE